MKQAVAGLLTTDVCAVHRLFVKLILLLVCKWQMIEIQAACEALCCFADERRLHCRLLVRHNFADLLMTDVCASGCFFYSVGLLMTDV